MRQKLLRYLILAFVFAAVPCLAQLSYAQPIENGEDSRQYTIAKELDCVEQHLTQEEAVSWDNVCYLGDSTLSMGRPRKGGLTPSRWKNNLAKISIVDAELDRWEDVEMRHERLLAEMPENPAKKAIAINRFDQPRTSLIEEQYARENARGKSDLHTMEGGWTLFGTKSSAKNFYKEKAVMNGFFGKYTYRPDKGNPLYTKAVNTYRMDGEFAWGGFDYQDIRDEYNGLRGDDIKSFMMDIRSIVGKEYVYDKFDALIYSGFGYRYFKSNEWRSTRAYDGNRYLLSSRQTRYYYLPIGLELVSPLKDDWTMTFNGEYDWLISGKVSENRSELNKYRTPSTYSDDVDYRQDTGFGLRSSVKLAKAFEQLNVFVEPFFRYWKIDQAESKTSKVGGVIDPTPKTVTENYTLEGGFKMGVQF